MSDENIKPPTTDNKILNPSLDCLKQEKITFHHGKIAKVYIVYEIEKSVNISSHPALKYCLFGAVKLTKHFSDVICINILDMELNLIEKDFFTSFWRKSQKCNNFWSRYELIFTY